MKRIEKRYSIRAPAEKVWSALVDTALIERWGAGPGVVMDEKPGTAFKLWGGDIHGRNLEVDRWKKLVQEWYGGDWDDYYMYPLKELVESI